MSTKNKAAKPASQKKKQHVGEATVSLRHDFTDKEYREVGGRLNVAFNEKVKLEAELDTLKKDYNARIAQQEASIDELQIKIGNAYEMRQTKVVVLFDPTKGRKTYFAPDDKKHKKPLGEADMMPGDYQTEMPIASEQKPAAPATAAPVPSNIVPMAPGQPLASVGDAMVEAEAVVEANAIEVIRSESKASVSLIQRRLKITYAQATAIIDKLERDGVIGPANGAEPRAILNLPPPQPTGTPPHDTANPPPMPEKKKSDKRKPTKAEFAEQQAAKGEGDK